jgi:ABC-type branched-subunit amino acid transport system ATPase component
VSAVLEARHLDAGYGAGSTVVRALDLEVRAGEIVALLGPNGAGKTTTLNTLCGELPSLGGDVVLHGHTVTGPLHERARVGLGLVAEDRAVLTRMSVNDNLRVTRADPERAFALFPELEPHAKRQVGLLSGGQQQMLALAIALSRQTTVLLADELSLGLAPLVVDRLLLALRRAADEGVAVLLVEQHIAKAMKVADRAYVMRRGQIEVSGSARELSGRLDEIQQSYFEGGSAKNNTNGVVGG